MNAYQYKSTKENQRREILRRGDKGFQALDTINDQGVVMRSITRWNGGKLSKLGVVRNDRESQAEILENGSESEVRTARMEDQRRPGTEESA